MIINVPDSTEMLLGALVSSLLTPNNIWDFYAYCDSLHNKRDALLIKRKASFYKNTTPRVKRSVSIIYRMICFPTSVLTNRFQGSGSTFSTPKSPPANWYIQFSSSKSDY